MPSHADLESKLTAAVDGATRAIWRVVRAWSERERLCLMVEVTGPSSDDKPLLLEIRKSRPTERAYAVIGDLAFSYRNEGRPLGLGTEGVLDRVVMALANVLSSSGFDPSVDELIAKTDDSSFPTPYQCAHLESELALPREVVESFRRDGHVLVRRALHRDVVLAARSHVLSALKRFWPPDLPPVEERRDAYARSFTQITDLGLRDPFVRVLSHARRIARMAADLMGVFGVRCFCEDWLIKEPGAAITPWHQDEAVFPFDAEATITCWIPFQDIAQGGGLTRFARGSHRLGVLPIEDISDTSEAEFAQIIAEHGLALDELPEVFVGDVSFHHGRTIHGAFPNTSESTRIVLALHCFAEGARLKEPTTAKMAAIFAGSVPGRHAGDPAVSEAWPLLYDASSSKPRLRPTDQGVSKDARFHLRATLLPTGESPVDLWIVDGRLSFAPALGAIELAQPGGFVTSGLVDSHSHISYPHDPREPVGTSRWMNERRAEYARTGVLVLRDMGAVDDAISALGDIPGLPRVHAAGNMILRHDQFPFTPTDPKDLVRASTQRIERGARWTKIFADWSDDYRGRINSGFTDRDEVTYPLGVLTEAVTAVHALGGRVAAHAFTREGARVAIFAGVDSLEHGWGLDEDLVLEMARRRIAWVPLVGIAPNMWRIARRERQPERAQWIEETMVRLDELLPLAVRRGVPVFAGTDLFPEVTVGDEIRGLHELGMDRVAALGAASWAARAWLDEPGLVEGAPADLVLYRTDPRRDLEAVFRPELILSGGVRVAPSFAHVRPRHSTWKERQRGDPSVDSDAP